MGLGMSTFCDMLAQETNPGTAIFVEENMVMLDETAVLEARLFV